MVNGIRASVPHELNKERGLKFRVSSRVRQKTPEEGRRIHRPKRCEYGDKDEDNSDYLVCKNTSFTNMSKVFIRNGSYPLLLIGMIYYKLFATCHFDEKNNTKQMLGTNSLVPSEKSSSYTIQSWVLILNKVLIQMSQLLLIGLMYHQKLSQ